MTDPKLIEAVGRAICFAAGKDCPAEIFSTHDKMAEAAISALTAAGWQRVPEGWKVVPRIPTRAMIEANAPIPMNDGDWVRAFDAAPAPEATDGKV